MTLSAAIIALIPASIACTWMACTLASAAQRDNLRRARRRIAELTWELESERRRNRRTCDRIYEAGLN